ncbi:MAG: BON domain-containing protein [Acidobacteriota bacterium]|nr:BON domain-containing protein [Acidobacteriota bacterium]
MLTTVRRVLAPALLALLLLAIPAAAKSGNTSDGPLQQKVQQELGKKKQWSNVHATVADGVVTLTGTVKTYADKQRAEHKAEHTDGVRAVVNQIVVDAGSASDEQLFQTIADKLRYDRVDQGLIMGVNRNVTAGNTFNNFNIDVKNGVVTISGNARTDTDAASAVALVENTPGVKDVIDNIEIAPASIMDDQLRIRVARALYGDPVLSKYAMDPQRPIRIIVENGHVTLDGMVLNEMDKNVAGIRANGVSGAFSVKNNLMVANQQPK